MKVLVCGGRGFNNYDILSKVLNKIHLEEIIDEICHGGATGADNLAGQWAKVSGVDCVIYPANWKKYGKSAGPIRNARMIDKFQPDLVIAMPGGAGTNSMIGLAKKCSIPVIGYTSLQSIK